jgi:pimeloyl-ACP methyl ester carboxylesterase
MGERDRKYVEQLRRDSASVETHVVANAGHRLPLDQPKELAKWIAHFIRTHQDTL